MNDLEYWNKWITKCIECYEKNTGIKINMSKDEIEFLKKENEDLKLKLDIIKNLLEC
jgi:hypothetical protein